MKMNNTHRERIENCLAGEPAGEAPVALWRHFPVDDQRADTLAAATIQFQEMYDFDFVKVTPSSSYCIADWGVKTAWEGHYHGTRAYTGRVIHHPDDWPKLLPLDPRQGMLGAMLQCLQILAKKYSPGTPVIQTIFSPMAQAKNLVGPEQLLVHMRCCPEALHAGLRTISETTLRFIEEAKRSGIDGIFYAVQHCQYDLLSREEFEVFGRGYDIPLLHSLPDFFLRVGHLHGVNLMFDLVKDYPVNVFNWHDRETYPSLGEGLTLFDGAVCGGLRQEETMVLGTPDDVLRERQSAMLDTQGQRFILGTGCVLPIIAPHGNIIAARHGKGAG